jgi:DNA-binding beta-propeller fold protein YncE
MLAGATMAQTPDGRHLVVGDASGRIDMFDLATGKLDRQLQSHSTIGIHVVAVSPNGRWLACGRTRGDVQFWDLTTGKITRLINAQSDPDPERRGIVERLAFKSDSTVLYTGIDPYQGAENAGASAWEVATGKKLWTMSGVGYNLAADPRGRFVVTGVLSEESPRVSLLDAATGRVVQNMPVEASVEPGPDGGTILEISATMDRRFTPDGTRVVSVHDDGTVRGWDIATGKEFARMKVGPAGSTQPGGLACSPDGRWVAIRVDRTVQVWELSSGRKVHTIAGLEAAPRELFFTHDGRGLIISSGPAPILWTLKPKERPRIDRPIDALWDTLASDDAAAAFQLVWALMDDPKSAIQVARHKVHPNELVLERSQFDRLVAALDGPRFASRERAEVELLRSGVAVPISWLRQAQAATKSEEVRARLGRVLTAREAGGPTQWRLERMVQVLEVARTDEATKLLKEWASGPPGGFLTEVAAGAVARLSR